MARWFNCLIMAKLTYVYCKHCNRIVALQVLLVTTVWYMELGFRLSRIFPSFCVSSNIRTLHAFALA